MVVVRLAIDSENVKRSKLTVGPGSGKFRDMRTCLRTYRRSWDQGPNEYQEFGKNNYGVVADCGNECAAAMRRTSATAADRSSSTCKVKIKRQDEIQFETHRGFARYRGVPTYADSCSAMIQRSTIRLFGKRRSKDWDDYNGSVVAVDPNSGRILTVVNQKIAFSDGYIPCSTIKPTIAIAALSENVITSDTMLKVGRRKYMNLTEALAHSNNVFFEELGRRMGFETVSKYGRLLGLGELAGYNLTDEHPGSFPTQAPAYGGVARMSSFGEGIQMTPLQLVAWAAAFANGGTLYYLQYPHSAEEVQDFQPKVKRDLNIANVLPEVREGMLAAVLYGTGVELRRRRR